MRILEAVKKGFQTANVNLNLVLGLFVFNFIVNVLNLPIQARLPRPVPGEVPPTPEPGWVLLALLFNVVVILIGIFIQGGLLNFLQEAVKVGEAAIARFWEGGKKFYVKLLLLGLLVLGFIIVGVLLIALIGGLISLPLKGTAVGGVLGALVTIIFSIVLVACLFFISFSPYAIVTQGEKVIGAIRRSIEFVRANLLRALGLILLLVAIGIGIGMAIGVILGIFGFLLKAVPVILRFISAILYAGLNAYLLVFGTAALMAFYLALAVKEEAPAPEAPPAPESPITP